VIYYYKQISVYCQLLWQHYPASRVTFTAADKYCTTAAISAPELLDFILAPTSHDALAAGA